jgi:DNA-binding HxlR family transcriptional regulator
MVAEGDHVEASSTQGLSYRQAVEEVMRVLNGQWVVAVLAALATGPLHFAELLVEVNAVEERVGRRTHDRPLSRPVLARTLDRMELADLLIRTADDTPHPSVWYTLTPTGRSLLGALRPLAEWAQRYRDNHPTTAIGGEVLPE